MERELRDLKKERIEFGKNLSSGEVSYYENDDRSQYLSDIPIDIDSESIEMQTTKSDQYILKSGLISDSAISEAYEQNDGGNKTSKILDRESEVRVHNPKIIFIMLY